MRMEDVFDLNELNVKKFVKYCKARPEDDEKDLMAVYAIVDDDGNIDPKTQLYFSKERYLKQDLRVWTMLGQLKAIHEGKHLLGVTELSTKYDGTRWTEDPNCVIFLFWLGNAGKYFGGLINGQITDLHDAKHVIWDWESPNDSNLKKKFEKWNKLVEGTEFEDPTEMRFIFKMSREAAELQVRKLAAIKRMIF